MILRSAFLLVLCEWVQEDKVGWIRVNEGKKERSGERETTPCPK